MTPQQVLESIAIIRDCAAGLVPDPSLDLTNPADIEEFLVDIHDHLWVLNAESHRLMDKAIDIDNYNKEFN